MRIRLHPGVVGCVGAGLVHLLARTVRVREVYEDARFDLHRADKPRAIYAFWHGRILLAALRHLNSGVCLPISRHRDGEYVARMATHIGARPIRGSSTRGGARALLALVRAAEGADIAVTPDGPRGPAYVVQPGIVHLARLAGRPIIAGGLEVSRAWVAPSWDEFTVPMPFCRLGVCGGRPIHVPSDADDDAVETVRARLERDLHRLTARARRLAAGQESIGRQVPAAQNP